MRSTGGGFDDIDADASGLHDADGLDALEPLDAYADGSRDACARGFDARDECFFGACGFGRPSWQPSIALVSSDAG